jgi:uncharacterized protein YcfJ
VEQISSLKLKRKKSGLRGMLIGAASGALAGVIIGFASGDDKLETYSNSSDPFVDVLGNAFVAINNAFAMTAGEKAAAGGLGGAVSGGLIGALIGNLVHKKFPINGSKEKFTSMRENVLDMAFKKNKN